MIRFATSYATSHDGVHWKVPDLDLYKIAGMADRNVVIPYGLMHGLFYEPHEPDPQKRFKALVCVEPKIRKFRRVIICTRHPMACIGKVT